MNQSKSTVTGTRGRCFDRRVKSHLYTRTTEGRQTAESRRASQMFLNASLIALQIPDQVVNREAEQAITPTRRFMSDGQSHDLQGYFFFK